MTRNLKELSKLVVPVQVEAIQNGLIHECRQKKGETVDDYTQELCRLYQKAYDRVQRRSPAVEAVGKFVLAYQIVSVLNSESYEEV